MLEREFAETTATQPELVAYHYTEAGLSEQAILYWQRAGWRAIERSANIEAVGHLTQGIALLKQLAETPTHLQQELELQTALGPALMVTRGYAAPEDETSVPSSAASSANRSERHRNSLPPLWGTWFFYAARPEVQKAVELARQLFTLARRAPDFRHSFWPPIGPWGRA